MSEENEQEKKKISFAEVDASINGLKRHALKEHDMIKDDVDNVIMYINHLHGQIKNLNDTISDMGSNSKPTASPQAPKKLSKNQKKSVKKAVKKVIKKANK